jgi:chaperonin GroES
MNDLAAAPVMPTGMSAQNPEGVASAAQQTGPDQEHIAKLKKWIDAVNIADDLDETLLTTIGARVVEEYKIDDTSRADWKTKTQEAMDLAMQVAKEKSFPWPKAANIIYPLVTTAATQFAARAYPAIINGRSIVKGVVVGQDKGTPQIGPDGTPVMQNGPQGPQPVWQVPPGAKRMKADQIGDHMSWQLLDEQPEWEPETDQLLHVLPIVGGAGRKSYFAPSKGRNVSTYVSLMKLVWNYGAKSFEVAARHTEEIEFYPREMEENYRSGIWKEPTTPFGEAEGAEGDRDKPHEFLEQHRYWDLDEDGYPEPYIVTVHKASQKVVRIVARYDADGIHFNARTHKISKIVPVEYYTLYSFLPNPDGGSYPIGFGQLLRPINEGINTVLNQMLDAATLQNAGGGFIGKGLSMNAGAIRFQMGEYKTVNVPGGTLRENIVPMDFKGPSPVLFELLGFLVEAGKEIAAVKDVLTGDQKASNVPATTTLALIEQGLKVFTAIYKRVHRALKSELNKLYRLNRVYGQQEMQFEAGGEWQSVLKQDYQTGSGVQPYSDPSMVSDMQKMARTQFLLGFLQTPFVQPLKILERAFDAADIENPSELLVEQIPPNPEIAAKGMELEIKGHEAQSSSKLKDAQAVAAYASAIKSLADADAAVGAQHLSWLDKVLKAHEIEVDAAMAPTKGADGSSKPAGTPPKSPNLAHPIVPGQSNNIQPEISDTDQMDGGLAGDPDGNLRMDPDSKFAADHAAPGPM